MTPDQRKAAILAAIIQWRSTYGFDLVPAHLVLAQSALETNNFTSRRIADDNNAFGMMHPRSRPTLSIGGGAAEPGQSGAFARYNSLEDSVRDYFMRQKNFRIPNTANAQEYVDATVASGYAAGRSYGSAWLRVYGEDVAQGPEVPVDPAAPVDEPDESGGFPVGLALLGAAVAVAISKS